MDNVSKRVEELIAETKLNELLRKKEEEKGKNIIVWVLAVLGAVAAVAGIAYAVYCFLTPDYLEDFEDDFEDDFDDYFEDEDLEDEKDAEDEIFVDETEGKTEE